MKAYKITATAVDNNNVWVASNNAETLGTAYRKTYLTREHAEAVVNDLAADRTGAYGTCEYEIEEIDINGLEKGKIYDIASVVARARPLLNGRNVTDYFSADDYYLGTDKDGVEVVLRK